MKPMGKHLEFRMILTFSSASFNFKKIKERITIKSIKKFMIIDNVEVWT